MKHYPLFEHWYKTTDWLLDKCDRMPKSVRHTVSGRIATLALDTLELLTEAAYSKEKTTLLVNANLNFEKLRLLLRLCSDRRYLSPAQHEFIQAEINTAGKMCGGWLKQQKTPQS